MTDDVPSRRPECPRCGRPQAVCWCRDLPQLATRTNVVFLQHRREAACKVGTARMASLCLPGSHVFVGMTFDDDPWVREVLSDPARPPVLLFPGPDAPDILLHPPAGPVTLVVIDGTWSQAGKMVRESPLLQSLPRYAFTPPAASTYRIRTEPAAECVSTIEALAYVLGVLEGDPERFKALLKPFGTMVDFQVAHAERCHQPRVRVRRRRKAPPPGPPTLLRDRPDDLILAAGESNAWPRRDATGIPDELVHWVALRPATGERFEAIVAPRHALCPSAELHAEVPAADLVAGESWASFAARWAAFLRPTDVLCTWGTYYSGLVASEGGALPDERLDVRHSLRGTIGHRVGSLEGFAEAIGFAQTGRGRAGVRLALLEGVIAWMLRQQ